MADSLTALLDDMSRARSRNGAIDTVDYHVFLGRLRLLIDGGADTAVRTPVVNGYVARGLPEGSWVIRADSEGTIAPGATPDRPDQAAMSVRYYRVLHVADEPPVKVGDEIKGRRANTLPEGSVIIRTEEGTPLPGQFPLTKSVRGKFQLSPTDTRPDLVVNNWTFRVLYLPEEN